MVSYQRAAPVLQVANVETSLRWYKDVLGFSAVAWPDEPPYTFAIVERDGAEIMLQCAEAPRAPDPEFLWSVYLRVDGTAILEVVAAIAKKSKLLRGPERMFYGLVEVELSDPDGYRIVVSGEAPPGANVKVREE
jgi:catechol 2,3-dioxygenase-like lactoylglutathione lyase family enzyme